MAYVARPSDFHAAVPVKAAVSLAAPRRRFWLRMLDAVLDARRHDAERAVADYVARRGKLTDSMEREIADRVLNNRM